MLNIYETYKIRLEAAFGGFCPKALLKSFSPEKLLSTPRARAAHSPLTKLNNSYTFLEGRMNMLDRLIKTTLIETALSRGAPSARARPGAGGCRAQSFNQNVAKSENTATIYKVQNLPKSRLWKILSKLPTKKIC